MRTIRFVVLLAALSGCGRTSPAPATTSSTESRTPSPESRKYLLERVDDAAVVQVYADGFDALPLREKTLIWHLYQAAHRRARHLLRPALRAQPRDARRARGRSSRIRDGHRSGDARRDPALHEAVLDQHRSVQQPDRAQVRAQVHARGVRRRGARPPQAAARASRRRPARSLDALLARLQPMFFDPDVDPIVTQQDAAAGQGHPHGEREQPVRRRRDDEGPRRASRRSTRSTRAS